jgi:cholesterol oxidase
MTQTSEPVSGRQPGTVGLKFTEEMKGYVTLGETDFQRGFKQGKEDGTFFMFHLTISTNDVDSFIRDPRHEATAEGWVSCEALGGKLPVQKGIFNLFVDTEDPDLTRMLYRLFFADGAGNPLTLTGFKLVKDDPGMDLWSDTSTLYSRVLRGHVEAEGEPEADVVASGIINIYLTDFARQLTTFRTSGGNANDQARALGAFGKLFLGKLWDIYGGAAKSAAAG